MPTMPPTVEYELTDLGHEILPAVDAIVAVGHRLKERRRDQVRPATPPEPAATLATGS